eukprot:119485-Chlamydomonas_euryale.AAC.1
MRVDAQTPSWLLLAQRSMSEVCQLSLCCVAQAGAKPPVKRDVAFADGGLDDSDDDMPLAQQRKAAVA